MTDSGGAMLSDDGRTLTVRVPFAVRKRGGRKLIVAPEGASWPPARPRVDHTMVKALARAFRWRRMLESGAHATVEDLAAAENISASYLCRILRWTLLAPHIIEAILDGRQPAGLQMDTLLKLIPLEWAAQRAVLGP